MGIHLRTLTSAFATAWLVLATSNTAQAQAAFEGGWTLNPTISNLSFQSVKKQNVIESSGFATFNGTIDETGAVEVSVLLDSVDTKIDLRNVRMRFLFFETFKHPEAKITAKIDPASIADLVELRRKRVEAEYTIDLHGITQTRTAELTVTLLDNDMVSIAPTRPIAVPVADFQLQGGLQKLQEAANVTIMPAAIVSFDWVFARNTSTVAVASAAAPAETLQPQNVALEVEGDFDLEACKGRFEILSRTGSIYFGSGSSRLKSDSFFLLDSLAGILSRCPGMVVEVAGHTDNVGTSRNNLRLSDDRANAVADYLLAKGIDTSALRAKGYGEDFPITSNDTREGRDRNRRIEFRVLEN
ncbi:MAG: OmpA family protein [Pseudomonadota bacterium]